MAERNIKLIVSYDGSDYHGWQVQPEHNTIQQELETSLEKLCGKKIKVTGASRTDAGVSALGQAVNFFIESPIPTQNFRKALNMFLPEDIAILEAVEVDASFNSITCAKNKWYRYTVSTTAVRPVLDIKHCWHRKGTLDVAKMNEAASLIVGKKDFKSFASAADERQSSVRTVRRCEVSTGGDNIYLDIEGDGFLYNMVRNIMGTLVEVGRGRWQPVKITEILEAKNRTAAGPLAPAQGLCLMRIDY